VRTLRTGGAIEEYFARKGSEWVLVASTLAGELVPEGAVRPTSPALAAGRASLLDLGPGVPGGSVFTDVVRASDRAVTLAGRFGRHTFTKVVRVPEEGKWVQVELEDRIDSRQASEPIEYLLLTHAFLAGEPDTVFVPNLRPEDDEVVGEHVFRSPALLAQRGSVAFGLVPDVHAIAECRPLPLVLDLDRKAPGVRAPLLSYGFSPHSVTGHVYYRHTPGQSARTTDRELRLACSLYLDAEAPERRGYEEISRHIWEEWGSDFLRDARPQTVPFETYAQVCYPAAFAEKLGDRALGWKEWDENGRRVGGVLSGWGYDGGGLGNQAWFSNLRSAVGLFLWGKRRDDAELVRKARLMLEFALAAPQKEGAFPGTYNVFARRWQGCLVSAGGGYYATFDCGWKAYWLLRWRELCEDDPRILPYVERYAKFVTERIEEGGSVPSWFTEDLRPVPNLRRSAQTAMSTLFLSELARQTKDPAHLAAAERTAAFLVREVAPAMLYHDFETFYSCSGKPETFADPHTGAPANNTLSMQWLADALLELHAQTKKEEYRTWGEAALDLLGLYQVSWPISYRGVAYTYGGFGVQNTDGEYNDARQAQFACSLFDAGVQLGRRDLCERGVAAARASFTLVNLPANVANGVYPNPNYPLGLEPENCGHGGGDHQSGRTGFDWGEGSALTTAAYLLERYGQGWLSEAGWGVGIDGVAHTGSGATFEDSLAALPVPPARRAKIRVARWDGATKEVALEDLRRTVGAPGARRLPSGDVSFRFSGSAERILWRRSASDAFPTVDEGSSLPLVRAADGKVLEATLPSAALGQVRRIDYAVLVGGERPRWHSLDLDAIFDFEDGSLEGWTIESDRRGPLVTTSDRCDFGKQGRWFLGTCEDGRGGFNDGYTAKLVSPEFTVDAPALSLLVGGGADWERTYVALVRSSDGKELFRECGRNDERMDRRVWDTRALQGERVRLVVVDRATGGWGHVNVDDVRRERP
jgi:hypothetical protein